MTTYVNDSTKMITVNLEYKNYVKNLNKKLEKIYTKKQ